MTRVTIRIDLKEGAALGPGKARLLELIGELGSIRRAAAAMDMSYRQGWLLVQDLEKTFGGAVIETARGGARGGGATLTALGRKLLACYRAMETKATRAVKADLGALAKLVETDAAHHRRSVRPRRSRSARSPR